MSDRLVWVDIPGFEKEYKVALYRERLIVFTKRKNKPMNINVSYTLSKDGKQTVLSESKLRKICGL